MKKLGFGLMRMPTIDKTNAADVDIEQVKKMVDLFMEKGFTYFDTALMYEERALCFKAADIINGQIAVPCTGCSYCTEGCTVKIAIPQYFSLYNEDMRENLEEKGWTVNFTNYDILTEKFGKAKDCIECGQCEGVCPQHLPIIKNLKAVSAHFDH